MRGTILAVIMAAAGTSVAAGLPPDVQRQADRYAEILARAPDHPTARERLWKLYADHGDSAALLERFRSGAKTSAADGVILGYLLMQSGNPGEAAKVFRSAALLDPESVLAPAGEAEAEAAAGRHAVAAEILERASAMRDLDPGIRRRLTIRLGEEYLAAGEDGAAVAAWERAIGLQPDDPELRRQLMEKYLAAGNAGAALPHVRWLAGHGRPSEQVDALIRESRIMESRGDLQTALRLTESVLSRLAHGNPRRAAFEQRMIDLHGRVGTLENYVASLRDKASPGRVADWLRLAQIHSILAQRDRQIEALTAAYQAAPSDISVATALAVAEADFGSMDAAGRLYDALIERYPGSPDFVLARADLDVRAGDLAAAQKRVEALLAASWTDESLRARCLAFYRERGMLAGIRELLATENQNPGDPDKARATARIAFASGAGDQGAEALVETDYESLDPVAGAAAAREAAGLLRKQGFDGQALEVARRAVELDPANVEGVELLSSLLAAAGDLSDAEAVVETAMEKWDADNRVSSHLDRHLFQLLDAPDGPRSDAGEPDLVGNLLASGGVGKGPSALVAQKLERLRQAFSANEDVSSAIRLARWQQWTGDGAGAAATLRGALANHSKSIPLREAAAAQASSQGDLLGAIGHLEALCQLAPERKAEFLDRIARLELDRSNIDRALGIHEDLVRAGPDSVAALMNLAAAQQQAGNYYNALETWSRAFEIAPAQQCRQMLPSILAVVKRLQLYERGVNLLVKAALAEPDEPGRISAWMEACAFAGENDASPVLEEKLKAEIRKEPGSYALRAAAAEVQRRKGDFAGSWRTLSEATDLAADRNAALARFFRAAQDAGESDAALRIAARIAESDPSFDSWQRLAKLQEIAGRPDDAAATWRGIRRRFGRETDVLEAVADFYTRIGATGEAAECRFAAAALDPPNPMAIARAGRLAMGIGDREKALQLYERLLAATPAGADKDLPLPGYDETPQETDHEAFSMAMRALGGLADADSIAAVRGRATLEPDPGQSVLRLEAIRAISRLATGGTAREEWKKAREDLAGDERVWAFYESGDYDDALDALEADDQADPGRRENAWVWIALRAGADTRLRKWINDDAENRRRRTEFLFLALSRILANRSEPLAADRIGGLFSEGEVSNFELWQAAWLFASHSDLRNAVRLAERALPDAAPQRRSEIGLKLASWQILLDEPGAAIATLESAGAAEANPISLDDAAFSILRMRWFLADPAERAAMPGQFPGSSGVDSVRAAASRALLYELEGEHERAAAEAEGLVSGWLEASKGRGVGRPFSDRVWSSVLQLHTWRLPKLAWAICEAAAKENAADIVLEGGDARRWESDLAMLAVLSKLLDAAPREVRFVVDNELGPRCTGANLASLARQLDAHGNAAAALQVREILAARFPEEFRDQSEQLAAAARAGSSSRRIELLGEVIESSELSSNYQALADTSAQLAEILIQKHDPARAIKVLDRPLELAPGDVRLVEIKDRALQALGAVDEKIALWAGQMRLDPAANTPKLARVYLATGREAEAAGLLKVQSAEVSGPATRDVRFELELGKDPLRAGSLLRQFAAQGDWKSVLELAPSLAGAGQKAAAVALLRQGLADAPKTDLQMAFAEALTDLLAPAATPEIADPVVRPAQDLLSRDPALAPRFHEIERKFGDSGTEMKEWLTMRLRGRWMDGNGNRLAGEGLIRLAIEAKDRVALGSLLDRFLRPAHFSAPALAGLAEILGTEGLHAESARVYRVLAARFPDRPEVSFHLAKELWKAGDQPAAMKAVTPWAIAREFSPAVHAYLAAFFRDIGEPERAAQVYGELVRDDVGVTRPAAWIGLSRLARAAGRMDESRTYLRVAFQNPENREWKEVVDFYGDGPELAELSPEGNEFGLPPELWDRVRLAIAGKLCGQGRFADALRWIPAGLLAEPEAARVLERTAMEGGLFEAAGSFWAAAMAELPDSRQLRGNHAIFLLNSARRSGSNEESLRLLTEANRLAPDHYEIASELATRLRAAASEAEARKVLEALILSDAAPADREQARALLESWSKTDGLIPRNEPS